MELRDLAGLQASNGEADDAFGHSVAVSGDTVLVGAKFASNAASAVDGDRAFDRFGYSLSISDDTITVWSPFAYFRGLQSPAGGVPSLREAPYLFERRGSGWKRVEPQLAAARE